MKTNTIKINGADVELEWLDSPDGEILGEAISSSPSARVGEIGPADGEQFELDGKKYRLGSHDYSTDQPGNEDDDECTCSAKIYAVEE